MKVGDLSSNSAARVISSPRLPVLTIGVRPLVAQTLLPCEKETIRLQGQCVALEGC